MNNYLFYKDLFKIVKSNKERLKIINVYKELFKMLKSNNKEL